MPGGSLSRLTHSSSDPCSACLCRLEAASVTARASWPMREAENRNRSAKIWTAFRQAGTALASSTLTHRMSCGGGAWSGQLSGTT